MLFEDILSDVDRNNDDFNWSNVVVIMTDLEEAKRLLGEALAAISIHGDTPPPTLYLAEGKRKITEALSLLEKVGE